MTNPTENPPRRELVARLRAQIAAGTYATPERLVAAAAVLGGLEPVAMHERTRPQLLAERDRAERAGDTYRVAQLDRHLSSDQ